MSIGMTFSFSFASVESPKWNSLQGIEAVLNDDGLIMERNFLPPKRSPDRQVCHPLPAVRPIPSDATLRA